MVIFTIFLIPETKGVPVERVQYLFAKHKIWRKVMGSAAKEIRLREGARTLARNAAEAADTAAAETGTKAIEVETVKKVEVQLTESDE